MVVAYKNTVFLYGCSGNFQILTLHQTRFLRHKFLLNGSLNNLIEPKTNTYYQMLVMVNVGCTFHIWSNITQIDVQFCQAVTNVIWPPLLFS